MNTHVVQRSPVAAPASPRVCSVSLFAPLHWIAAGVDDLRYAPLYGLLYGLLFTAACGLTYALVSGLPWFTIAFLTGLLLIGPYLASGVYLAARQRESGEPVSIRAALAVLAARKTNMAFYGVFLALLMVVWVRLAALLFAVQFTGMSPTIDDYLGVLSGGADPWVLAFFVGIGLMLAITVFVTSAVSVPLIIDRDQEPLSAIRTSARVVVRNWPAMSLWAALIVILTAVGIATFGVGLVVLFPVLGYATWHSYRDLVA
jgi:uncharacterized membrane protein